MTRFFLAENTEPPSGAASHRDLHAGWGGSDLHIRGCDCLDCCPGSKAVATRVYTDPSAWLKEQWRRNARALAKRRSEHHKELRRRWREAHREEQREYARAWRAAEHSEPPPCPGSRREERRRAAWI